MIRRHAAAALAAAVLALSSGGANAAPSTGATGRNFTPLAHLAFGECYGGYTTGFGWCWGYDYKPACPDNYEYSCWEDAHGYRHCGCVLKRRW